MNIKEDMTSIDVKDGSISAWVTSRWSLPGHTGEPVVRTVFRSRYDGTNSAVHMELSIEEVNGLVTLLRNHQKQLAQF
jgi:hypothetical protein